MSGCGGLVVLAAVWGGVAGLLPLALGAGFLWRVLAVELASWGRALFEIRPKSMSICPPASWPRGRRTKCERSFSGFWRKAAT